MKIKTVLSGELDFMNLAEVLQFLSKENATGVLRLVCRHTGNKGAVFISRGNPVDASFGDKSGKNALYPLFGWDQGTFEFSLERVVREDVIEKKMMAVVLDALRMVDEGLIKKSHAPLAMPASADARVRRLTPIKGPAFFDYMYIVDEEEYPGNNTIVEQGGYGSWVWVILEGVAEIRKKTTQGERAVARLGSGTFIGGLSPVMQPDLPRNISAVARGGVHLGVIDIQQLTMVLSRLSPKFRELILSLERRLEKICERFVNISIERRYRDGLPPRIKPLIHQGDRISKAYVIRQGEAYVVRTSSEKQRYLFNLGPGDFIGPIPFMDVNHEPSSVSVFASEDLKLEILDVGELEREYESLPDILKSIMASTCISISAITGVTGR